jgi:hypothetical protein
MNDLNTLCPSCATAVGAKTLKRFNGVCRRCHKQPLAYRTQWIVLALIALTSPLAAVLMDGELAALEADGGTRRVHVLVAICYRVFGRIGVALLFLIVCIASAVFAIKAFRSAKAAKNRLANAKQLNSNVG